MHRRWPVPVAALLLASAAPAAAQVSPCTYDSCALRLQHRFFGGIRVVQGITAVPASKARGFGLRVEALAEAPDSAVRIHYAGYRRGMTRTGVFGLIGAVTFGAGYYLNQKNSNDNQGAQIALLSVGAVTAIVAAVNASRANDHLQQAIWYYNRGLPR